MGWEMPWKCSPFITPCLDPGGGSFLLPGLASPPASNLGAFGARRNYVGDRPKPRARGG